MRKFEITYFDNGDASSGTPYVVSFHGRDHQEAVTQFNYNYPARTVWSVDEVDPDYSSHDLNLE